MGRLPLFDNFAPFTLARPSALTTFKVNTCEHLQKRPKINPLLVNSYGTARR
jgi:hypothetical protein